MNSNPMSSGDLQPDTLSFELKRIHLSENEYWTATFVVRNNSDRDVMLPLLPGNEILAPTVQVEVLDNNQWKDVTPFHDSAIPLSPLGAGKTAVLNTTLPFKRGQEPPYFRVCIKGQYSQRYEVGDSKR